MSDVLRRSVTRGAALLGVHSASRPHHLEVSCLVCSPLSGFSLDLLIYTHSLGSPSLLSDGLALLSVVCLETSWSLTC